MGKYIMCMNHQFDLLPQCTTCGGKKLKEFQQEEEYNSDLQIAMGYMHYNLELFFEKMTQVSFKYFSSKISLPYFSTY